MGVCGRESFGLNGWVRAALPLANDAGHPFAGITRPPAVQHEPSGAIHFDLVRPPAPLQPALLPYFPAHHDGLLAALRSK
jgi:hypothetical protein